MNELLKVTVTENEEQTVRGRELHAFLEIETRYNDWFGRMLQYGFVEGVDFYSFSHLKIRIVMPVLQCHCED